MSAEAPLVPDTVAPQGANALTSPVHETVATDAESLTTPRDLLPHSPSDRDLHLLGQCVDARSVRKSDRDDTVGWAGTVQMIVMGARDNRGQQRGGCEPSTRYCPGGVQLSPVSLLAISGREVSDQAVQYQWPVPIRDRVTPWRNWEGRYCVHKTDSRPLIAIEPGRSAGEGTIHCQGRAADGSRQHTSRLAGALRRQAVPFPHRPNERLSIWTMLCPSL